MVTGATLKGFTSPGGYAAVSGWGPASGLSGIGSLSGPWYVEEQSLHIVYKRVPVQFLQHGSLNLSAGNLVGTTAQTHMIERVSPLVIKRKVYDDYATSTYTQPQRFTVYSTSEDYTGMSYGTPVAGTLSVEGSIVTTQNFYHRRLWTDQDGSDSLGWTSPGVQNISRWHSHHQDSCDYPNQAWGVSYRVINNQDCYVESTVSAAAQTEAHVNLMPVSMDNVDYWLKLAGSTSRDNRVQAFWGRGTTEGQLCYPTLTPIPVNGAIDNHRLLTKRAGYSSTDDTTADVSDFIDAIADIIAKPFESFAGTPLDYFLNFFSMTPVPPADAIRCQGQHALNNPDYDKTRHYFG